MFFVFIIRSRVSWRGYTDCATSRCLIPFLSYGVHNSAYVSRFEDKYPPFSVPWRDDFAFLFNEELVMSEPNLHSLVDDLSKRHTLSWRFSATVWKSRGTEKIEVMIQVKQNMKQTTKYQVMWVWSLTRRGKQNCEISHIDRTHQDPRVYKHIQNILFLSEGFNLNLNLS